MPHNRFNGDLVDLSVVIPTFNEIKNIQILIPDLEKSLAIAAQVHEFADILEIGTLLIYAHGVQAVDRFRQAFPQATLFADTKIIDRGKESSLLFTKAKSNWII